MIAFDSRTGSVTVFVERPVVQVVGLIERWVREKGAVVFDVIDHGAAARAAGLELREEVVIVFGNPRVGTVLMEQDPNVALDLPLRVLVYEDRGNSVVTYRDPNQLRQLYDVGASDEVIDQLSALMHELVTELTVGASNGSASVG
ncbi:DUF302 domain-containing protein [Protaetiibacter intestinalis]|uniref:DUF302 domain-containing protein n=1 Tax=Protaetiibacter intestinalis TaxID=2419774 RepID=UPI0013007815|nr:DUF302 domain-containing protein [Protaetiibacter intestinalis]